MTCDSLGSIWNGISPEPHVAYNQLTTIGLSLNRHDGGCNAYVGYCTTSDIELEDREITQLGLHDKLESSWGRGRITCLEVL